MFFRAVAKARNDFVKRQRKFLTTYCRPTTSAFAQAMSMRPTMKVITLDQVLVSKNDNIIPFFVILRQTGACGSKLFRAKH